MTDQNENKENNECPSIDKECLDAILTLSAEAQNPLSEECIGSLATVAGRNPHDVIGEHGIKRDGIKNAPMPIAFHTEPFNPTWNK
jgi:hypothetical protein